MGIKKSEFEAEILPSFYSNAITEIRRSSLDGVIGDDKAFVFIEPRLDWTTYATNGPKYDGLKFNLSPSTLLDVSNLNKERLVFSYPYYDPWTLFWGSSEIAPPVKFLPNLPDNMHNREREWPGEFRLMRESASSRNLIPFMTEFGGSQDWQFNTDLNPSTYHHKQICEYMDLQFKQVESNLLNAIYWNYNLYNTEEGKDNWNLENFSLLGPDRTPVNLDIVARPYPMRSSAEPSLLFFDLESKHCVVMLKGPIVDFPTVIYVPSEINYPTGFEVKATSKNLQWDEKNQYLFWLPDKERDVNQIIVFPPQSFDENKLPEESKKLLSTTNFGREFGRIVITFIEYNPEGSDVEGEYVLSKSFWRYYYRYDRLEVTRSSQS